MKNAQHTPGPWVLTDTGHIDAENREKGAISIAKMAPYSPYSPEYGIKECAANARLIIAATDMFLALQKIEGGHYPLHIMKAIGTISLEDLRDMMIVWLQETARAAISKASGEI